MTFNVLVAEPADQQWALIANGIRRYRPQASILRVKDGEQAVRFLFYRGLFAEVPETPDLVVLARYLPTVATEAIVARLRQHPRTGRTPVVILGRGRRRADVAKALEYQQWLQQQQWLVALGTDDVQRDIVEAVQSLCDEPPPLIAPLAFDSREATKAN